MKRKFTVGVAIGCALVLGTVSGIRLFGQQNGNQNGPDRPRSNNPFPNNHGPQSNGQLTPANGVPVHSYGFGYPQPQQGWNPGGPDSSADQRMIPYTFSGRTPEGTLVTSQMMLPEEEVKRLNASRQVVREAQTKLRSPDASDSDKKEARESIAKYLKEEFERDQKTRREQVERLEEQVAKLRKQLDKRQESQSKIIELRMQLLENEADGLAFPESFNDLNGFSNGPQGNPVGPHFNSHYAPSNYPGYSPPQMYSQPYPLPVQQMQYGQAINPSFQSPPMNIPRPKTNPPREKQESNETSR